jgi:hypothetical protein
VNNTDSPNILLDGPWRVNKVKGIIIRITRQDLYV